jgi:two-component system, OmpR family, phosphate regulon sensor histidine kinase PhoR
MNDGMFRALLGIAGVLVVALVLGLFSGPAGGIALCSAALFCAMACRLRWLQPVLERHEPQSAESLLAPLAQFWARAMERLRPDAGNGTAYALGSLSYGVCVLDRQFHVVWCNASAAEHFGLCPETAVGRPFSRSARLAAYVAAGDFAKPLQMESAAVEGTVLSVALVPYMKSQWLLLSRDVTLDARSEAARRDGVADALHELCTPVTVLAGYLDAVGRLRMDPRRAHDYLRAMEEQCRRMQRTIDDLLDLWTLGSESAIPRYDRVAVGSLLVQITQDAQALSRGEHRVLLDAQPGVDLLGTESEIASAFGNLVVNAIRYTPAGGEIKLSWRTTADGAEFAVQDNGIGIAQEHIPRLTERFYRVNRELSRQRGGTGLGLAIVKDVLDRHQATLAIQSQVGVGSCFRARFPAHRILVTGAPAAASEAELPSGEPHEAPLAGIQGSVNASRIVVPLADNTKLPAQAL